MLRKPGKEFVFVKREQRLRVVRRHGPDETVVIALGEERDRARRRETLVREPVVRRRAPDSGDESDLSVVVTSRAIPATAAPVPSATAARRASKRLRRAPPRDGRVRGRATDGFTAVVRERHARRAAAQHRAQPAARGSSRRSQAPGALLRRVELHAAEASRLRDVDPRDRRHGARCPTRACPRRRAGPESAAPHAKARASDRRVAFRPARARRARRRRVRCRRGPARASCRPDRHRRRYVMQHRLGAGTAWRSTPAAASTSATDFGVAAVRFSMPVDVTSTSSSIRTPMSQNSSGTLSAGRM